MSIKSKILKAAAALVLVGGATTLMATSAHAASGFEWSFQVGGSGPYDYINAWNGGPWVDVYQSEGATNNDFTIIKSGSYYNLEFTGGGAWNGHCAGDAYNSPDYVTVSLDACGTGWGVNLQVHSCSSYGISGYAFYDNRWGRYLEPGANSNGANFDFNAAAPGYCFHGQPYLQPLP